jgi:mannose-P-dolichol utilization defect protein 1
MKLYHLLLFSLLLWWSGDGFVVSLPLKVKHSSSLPKTCFQQQKVSFEARMSSLQAQSSSDIVGGASRKSAANIVGYVMGAGSLALYTPIIAKLLRNQHADGFSLTTWIFNLLGLLCSISYKVKKQFPVSTYIELIFAGLQSAVVLGLVSFYNGKFREYLAGITSLALIFGMLLTKLTFPNSILNALQIASTILSNYANIPQIWLTFQTQKASWSAITASLTFLACVTRIFTTLQLTRDNIVLGGYVLGMITNGILLAQIFTYR